MSRLSFKFAKKFLAVVLALVFVISMFPGDLSLFTAGATGSDDLTQSEPLKNDKNFTVDYEGKIAEKDDKTVSYSSAIEKITYTTTDKIFITGVEFGLKDNLKNITDNVTINNVASAIIEEAETKGSHSVEINLNNVDNFTVEEQKGWTDDKELVLKIKYLEGVEENVEGTEKTIEKHFIADKKAPVVKNIKITNDDKNDWYKNDDVNYTKGNVQVSFEVSDSSDFDVNGEGFVVSESDGVYTAKFEKLEKSDYKILVKDAVGNNDSVVVISGNKYIIDRAAPEIKTNVNPTTWTKGDATITVSTNDVSGVKNVTLGADTKNVDENGKCTFTVSERKDYTVTAIDNVGNESNLEISEDEILIDKEAPKSDDINVAFSGVTSDKNFGLYSNGDIKVTVKVADCGLSEIANVKLYANSSEEPVCEANSNKLEYVLNKKIAYKNLYFEATDEAGNVSERFKLSKVNVDINDNKAEFIKLLQEEQEKLFEIISGCVAPTIDIKAPTSAKTYTNGDNTVYGGKITFTADVADTLSGLNDVKCYFGNASEISIKNGEANVAESALVSANIGYTQDENIENKTISAKVSYTTDENLSSGKYYFVVVASNNAGVQSNYIPCEVTVDNTAPVVTEIKFSDRGRLYGSDIYCSEDISVTVTAEDEGSELESVKLYNRVGESYKEVGGSNGVFAISDAGEYDLYVEVEDVLGNKTELVQLSSIEGLAVYVGSKKISTIGKVIFDDSEDNIKYDKALTINCENGVVNGNIYSGNDVSVALNIEDTYGFESVSVEINNTAVPEKYISYSDDRKSASIAVKLSDIFGSELASGEYKLTCTSVNYCGVDKSYTYDPFFIDNTAPEIENILINGENYEEMAWTNDKFKISFEVTDDRSGVKNVIVTNSKNEELFQASAGGNCFVTCSEKDSYTITATDNSGNVKEFIIDKDYINYDTKAPTAKDVTAKFTSSDSGILKFLTFGLYSNAKVNVQVTAKHEDGEAPIASVQLFDGDEALSKKIKGNTLSCDLDVDTNKSYDLYVEVFDEAGNSAKISFKALEKINVNQNDEALVEGFRDSFEIIINKIGPTITVDVISAEHSADEIYGGKINVTAKVDDVISGFDSKDVNVYFDKAKNFSLTDGKITDLSNAKKVEATKSDEKVNEKVVSCDIEYTVESKIESGDYYFVVEATNNSGVKSCKYKKIVVDNSAPYATDVEFTSESSAKVTAENYGIYSDKPLTVKVYAKDDAPSCGVEKIQLFDGETECTALENNVQSDEKGNYNTFTLPVKSSKYDLSVLVTDKFGNTDKSAIKLFQKNNQGNFLNVSCDGKKLVASDGFEVVVSDNESNVTRTTPVITGLDYSDNGSKIYGGKSVNVKFTLTNTLSYIKSFNAQVAYSDMKDTTEDYKDIECVLSNTDSNQRATTDVTVNLPTEKSGKYELKFTVEDNCGNIVVYEDDFRVDNSKAVGDDVTVKLSRVSTFTDDILSYLTFGLYTRSAIYVEITANTNSLSEISSIVLKNGEEEIKTVVNSIEENDEKSTICFMIDNSDSIYDLGIIVTDAAGNESDLIKIEDVAQITIDAGNPEDLVELVSADEKKFEIVSSKVAPVIEIEEAKEISENTYDSEKDIFTDTVKFTASVKDALAGFNKNELNDQIKCYFVEEDKFDAAKNEFTDNNVEQLSQSDVKITAEGTDKLTSVDIEYVSSADLANGIYYFVVYANNNCNSSSQTYEKIVVDNTAPVVESVRFNGGKFINGGLYTDNEIELTVKVTDADPSVGIDDDGIVILNNGEINSEKIKPQTITYNADGNYYEKTFKILCADEPYKLSVYATDRFKHKSDVVELDKPENVDVYVGDDKVDSIKELVVNKDDSNIDSDGFKFDFKSYTDPNYEYRYRGDGSISIIVKDELSGISEATASLDGNAVDKASIKISGNNDSTLNIDFNTISIYENGIESGKHTVSCTVTNHAGVNRKFEKVFYIDNTAPDVLGVSFGAVTNVKEHGIYTNKDLKMTVTVWNENEIKNEVENSNTPLQTISVVHETLDGDEVLFTAEKDESDEIKFSEAGNGKYTADFVISASELQSKIYNLAFVATDEAGNIQKLSLNDKELTVSVNSEEIKDKKLRRTVVSLATPVFAELSGNEAVKAEYTSFDGEDIYGGKGKYTITVSDEISGLDTIEAYFAKLDSLDTIPEDVNKYITPENRVINKTGLSDGDDILTEETVVFDTEKLVKYKDSENQLLSEKYIYIVEATNLSGVSKVVEKVHYIDNSAPYVTKVEFTNEDTTAVTMAESYGIYSNKPLTVKVYAKDDAPSCGVEKIQLFDGETEYKALENSVQSDENGNYNTFTLPVKSSKYDLSVLVTDKFGNADKSATKLSENNNQGDAINVVCGEYNGAVDNGFEVVVTNNVDNSSKGDPVYKPEGGPTSANNGLKIYRGTSVQSVCSLRNELSYINEVSTRVYYSKYDEDPFAGDPNENQKEITDYTFVLSNDEPTQRAQRAETQATVTIPTTESGRYDIEYSVVDNCGNTKIYQDTFYVDNTAPTVEGFKFYSSVENKVLNFLTFGIYSSNSIKVDVTVNDAFPSSSINGGAVKAECSAGGTITAVNGINQIAGAWSYDEGMTYIKTFILESGNDKHNSLFDGLKVSAKDVFSNEGSATVADKSNIENADYLEDTFEIVSTVTNPTINDASITPTSGGKTIYKPNKDDNNYVWYALDDEPVLTFKATDEISGLNYIKVSLNGFDVTKFCTDTDNVYKKGEYPSRYTNFETHEGEKIESKTVSLNIKDLVEYKEKGKFVLNTTKTPDTSSKEPTNNKLEITARGNSGLSAQKRTLYFNIDDVAPVIKSINFKDAAAYNKDKDKKGFDSNGEFIEAEDDSSVEITDYGYFFKDKTYVTVKADDHKNGSGISDIRLYKLEVGSDEFIEVADNDTKKSINANTYVFTIEANFKGTFYVVAYDNVLNKSPNCYPDKLITEDIGNHESMSEVNVKLNDRENGNKYKDVNNRPLYDDNVKVIISAEDEYNGISKIEYQIFANGTSNENDIYTLNVPHDGTVKRTFNGWTVEKDDNIITKMSKNIVVKKNSNNIVVKAKITDNAGFVTEGESRPFSIDKTSPKISVSYSPASPENGTAGDAKYFQNRKATITVTERNFDWKDFEAKLKNEHSWIPSIVPGANWKSYSVPSGVGTEAQDAIKHVATIDYSKDGDYTFSAKFKDLADNETSRENNPDDKFTVDNTKPEISVTYSIPDEQAKSTYKNAGYFKDVRTATIKVVEHNFDKNQVKIDCSEMNAADTGKGTKPVVSWDNSTTDVHTATIKFDTEGNYRIKVNYSDKALNKAEEYLGKKFYYDKSAGKIEIKSVENEHAYGNTIAPVVRFDDNNFDISKAKVTLSRVDSSGTINTNNAASLVPRPSSSAKGASYVFTNFPVNVANDGIYVLKATMSDRSDNRSSKEIMFSVNRFGSSFMPTTKQVSNKIATKYAKGEFDLLVTEVNVTPVSSHTVTISRNGEISTLKNGKGGYSITSGGGKGKWHEYRYTIDKSNFKKEGSYIVTVSSVDKAVDSAGKRVSNRTSKSTKPLNLEFIIDKTEPLITVSGIESNAAYEEAYKDVKIVCEDTNLTDKSFKLIRNGEVIPKTDYRLDMKNGVINVSLKLEAKAGDIHEDLKIQALDKAGNVGEITVANFVLSASPLTLFLSNTPLVVAVCVLLAALLGLLIFFIIKRRKKSEEETA